MKLQYFKPAKEWTQALPIGNGRLGAMVFGGIESERLQLNEDTIWSGRYHDWECPEAKEVLSEIRKLLMEEKYLEADQLSKKLMGPYTESYLPLGDLSLNFEHGHLMNDYKRWLDLEDGIARVEYQIGDTVYTREVLASYPDQVIALHLKASQQGMLNFHARLSSPLRSKTNIGENKFILRGIAPEFVAPHHINTDEPIKYGDFNSTESIRFESQLLADVGDGRLEVDHDGLHIFDATEVTLYLAAATSFNGFDQIPITNWDEVQSIVENKLHKISQSEFTSIKSRHLNDYQSLFKRVDINLGETLSSQDMSTDQRIDKYGASDPGLVELLFQYGRYLLISSSRSGAQPANLQGIWNDKIRARWSSNYTININTEMNYWLAEPVNLSECHEPLINFISNLSQRGSKTADILGARGWVAHHNTDIWCQTAPSGGYGQGEPVWAMWHMGGAWLSQHLWEHFLFTQDKDYLKEKAYPILKDAALFCLDWLIEDENGYLVTAPSTSPEHKFIVGNEKAEVGIAASMDLQIIWELFSNCIEATKVLETDEDFREELSSARSRLYPLQVGKHGQLQEWYQDFEEEDINHRHAAHMFGVYPGKQITELNESELFNAAKVALDRRGDGGTGWSLAWKVGLWARFGDGNRSYRLLSNLLNLVYEDEEKFLEGGVYANLLDSHPPFQIDGNFGITASIVELIIQSHEGFIHLLPSLPDAWADGSVDGIRVRGGYEVSLQWEDKQITQVEIIADTTGTCQIKTDKPLYVADEDDNKSITNSMQNGLVTFQTEKGKRYILKPNE